MSSSTIYSSPLCSCILCREIKSTKGIHSHYISAHTKTGNLKRKSSFQNPSALANRAVYIKNKNALNEALYFENPNYCKQCNATLPYKQRMNKFCSSSCSASFNNAKRTREGYAVSETHKQQVSTFMTGRNHNRKILYSKVFRCKHCGKYHQFKANKQTCCLNAKQHSHKTNLSESAPYTKVILCSCTICAKQFYAKTYNKYCQNCKFVAPNIRAIYRFKFNLYDYPDLFDLELLSKVGFYSPGGKSGRWNIEGFSRDHRVSISEAIANRYDPYYISHPINCELMSHKANSQKKGKSSISYQDLIIQVENYDKLKSGVAWI